MRWVRSEIWSLSNRALLDNSETFEFRKGSVAALKRLLGHLDEVTSESVDDSQDDDDVLPL